MSWIFHTLKTSERNKWIMSTFIMDPDSSFTFWSPSFTKGSISLLWWSLLPHKAIGLGATCAKCLQQETRCSISFWKKTERWMNTELRLMYKSCHWSQQCEKRRGGAVLEAHTALLVNWAATQRHYHLYSSCQRADVENRLSTSKDTAEKKRTKGPQFLKRANPFLNTPTWIPSLLCLLSPLGIDKHLVLPIFYDVSIFSL